MLPTLTQRATLTSKTESAGAAPTAAFSTDAGYINMAVSQEDFATLVVGHTYTVTIEPGVE